MFLIIFFFQPSLKYLDFWRRKKNKISVAFFPPDVSFSFFFLPPIFPIFADAYNAERNENDRIYSTWNNNAWMNSIHYLRRFIKQMSPSVTKQSTVYIKDTIFTAFQFQQNRHLSDSFQNCVFVISLGMRVFAWYIKLTTDMDDGIFVLYFLILVFFYISFFCCSLCKNKYGQEFWKHVLNLTGRSSVSCC